MFFQPNKDNRILLGCVAGSFIAYHGARYIISRWNSRKAEWIPVGHVKSLHLYPMKSGMPTDVFTFKCTKTGAKLREMGDRVFMLVDLNTGRFLTARQKPKLVKIRNEVINGKLIIEVPGLEKVTIDLEEVVKNGKLIRATMFDNLKQDGYDCGDEVANVLCKYVDEENVRLIYHKQGMYTERTVIPDEAWWNTPVPKRKDDAAFNDLAPFMITTEASLNAVNERLEKKVTFRTFRPSIQIEGNAAWDEDRWAELRFGDVKLECFAPCTRCVLTSVSPEDGVMNPENEPVRTLRKFRLVPDGKMRKAHKDSPVFGVYAGLNSPEGYIHVGQPVYARYKSTEY